MEQKTPREDILAEPKSGLMAGKRGLVMGVANDHSIAWGIARTLSGQGAEIAFTYQGDAQKEAADAAGIIHRLWSCPPMWKATSSWMRYLRPSKRNGARSISWFTLWPSRTAKS